MSERPQPLKAINKLFEGKEAWQIVTMTASSVLAIVWAHSLYNARESPTTRLRKEFFRWLCQVPIVRRMIEEKMAEIKRDFRRDVTKRLAGVTVRRELPEYGFDPEQVMEEVRDHVALGAYNWQGGAVSGAVYHVSQEISKVACDAYSLTAYTNPLHADVFPGINKMEAEVVRMAVNLFHGDEDCCGTVTTGGTESIIMACKAFRDLAYSKGISNPQIIVPSTVHCAFDKAAQYLGLSVKTIKVNQDTMTVDVEKVRKAIGRRTCLIVGSAPNYPYGTMDDIIALSDVAVEYDIPLHVDACLGGFVAAFMIDAGHHVPVFDFRLPGVASMSADTHKYGFAPKGTSVVLYRKQEYRHHQYTVTTEWPGGVYGSPTVNGSRAGGLIAACWATMMFVGKKRYVQMTDEIIKTARYIENEVRKIPGLFVFGKPATSVIAFGSTQFDIFKIAELLHKKGWSLKALQFPSGVHICITHAHTQAGVADRFVTDMRDAARTCLKDSHAPVEGKMAIYGVAQEISDRSLVSDITKYFIDSMYYLPNEDEQTTHDDKNIAKINALQHNLKDMESVTSQLKKDKDSAQRNIENLKNSIRNACATIKSNEKITREEIDKLYTKLTKDIDTQMSTLQKAMLYQKNRDERERLRKEVAERRAAEEAKKREQDRIKQEEEHHRLYERERLRKKVAERRAEIDKLYTKLTKDTQMSTLQKAMLYQKNRDERERLRKEVAERRAAEEAKKREQDRIKQEEEHHRLDERERLRKEVAERRAAEEAKKREQDRIKQEEEHHRLSERGMQQAMQGKQKYDLSKWKFSELRHTIYTSCDIELLEVCRHEFHRRLKVYHTWRAWSGGKITMADQERAPQSIRDAAKTPRLPQKGEILGARHRYFRISFERVGADVAGGAEGGEGERRGWWYAHFDGQYVARQMVLHPDTSPVLLQAGVDDLDMCELNLEETGLTRNRVAEILEHEFDREWARHGGPTYVPYDARNR